MSIKTALESEGVDFSEYMNIPEPRDGTAQIKIVNGEKWVSCPYCGKRALKILPTTKIHRMPYKCKGSNCKKEFMVNV
jgi:DNA-directed RNA polymerase subunit RPC12/RpoP